VGIHRTSGLWSRGSRSSGSCKRAGALWYGIRISAPCPIVRRSWFKALTRQRFTALFVSSLSAPFAPHKFEEYLRQALAPPLLINSHTLFLAYLDNPSDPVALVLQGAIDSLAPLLNVDDVVKMLQSVPSMQCWPSPSQPQLNFFGRLAVRIPAALLKDARADVAFAQLYASTNLSTFADLIRYVDMFGGEGASHAEDASGDHPGLVGDDEARVYYRNGLVTLGPAADARLALSYIVRPASSFGRGICVDRTKDRCVEPTANHNIHVAIATIHQRRCRQRARR
jgi:hypothetical protein